jgi:O-glycosyl hydrolase
MKLRTLRGLMLSFCLVTAQTQVRAAEITIDATQVFQTMDGFGMSERVFDDSHVFEMFDPATGRSAVIVPAADQEAILNRLYTELKLNRIRPTTENGLQLTKDGPFNFEWKRNDAHIDLVKRVLPKGAKTFFLSPIVYESWMNRTDPTEYADYMMTILRRWKAMGAEPTYHSIANEPGYFTPSPLSGAFVRDAIKLLGPRLQAEGFATKFVITDDLNPSEALSRCQTILADSQARQYVAAVATHLYGAQEQLPQLKALADSYSLPLWMTEYAQYAGFTPWDWASLMSRILNQGVSAIDYMWGYFGQWQDTNNSAYITLEHSGSTYTGYKINKSYYVTGQYSRFVERGARRIATNETDFFLSATAFVKDNQLTVVVVNLGPAQTISVSINGFSGLSTLQATRTSATENWATVGNITVSADTFSTNVPASSVTTFSGSRSGGNPPIDKLSPAAPTNLR